MHSARTGSGTAAAVALATLALWCGLAGGETETPGRYGPLVVRRASPGAPTAGASLSAQSADRQAAARGREARLRALGEARAAGRGIPDALMRPGASLGVRKLVDGRRVPVRAAASPRAEMLRRGALDELALGELARTPAPEAAAAGLASVPGQDTVRILALRIDFLTDRSGSQTTGDGRWDRSPPDTVNVPVDPTPHNRAYVDAHMRALANYWRRTTAGRLVVEWEVYPQADTAYHATDMADFGPWRFTPDIFPIAYDMFRAWIAAADTQDASLPWDRADRVMLFHAGSDLQSDVRQDSPNDIPTFTIGLDDSLALPVADSTVLVYSATIMPETVNQDGYFTALNAVNVHESGHNIVGWRDVYDVYSGYPVCGEWTLMDTGNLVGSTVQVGEPPNEKIFYATGILPPLTDPYQRHLLYDDVPATDLVRWGELDSLASPLVTNRVLKVPLSSDEYLLLENRQADLNGDGQIVLVRDPQTGVILGPGEADSLEYDYLLPGDGVIAWQIDASIVDFDPKGRRADDYYTLNGDPARRGVQIFEADGLDDLGDFTSPFALGSPLDAYFVPNNGQLGSGTRPPLVTNSLTDPHVTVEVLDTLSRTMRVRVSRDWATPGWPVVARPGKTGVDPLVFDFGSAAVPQRRVVYAAGDSAIHARRPDGSPGGGASDVLWRAPAALSRIAALGDPLAGAPVVAVYPDPAALNDSAWATEGSWVVAVDGSGDPLAGFPVRVPPLAGGAADWITAGPVVQQLTDVVADGPVILVGTRSGQVYMVTGQGVIAPLAGYWTGVGGSAVVPTGAPILAISSATLESTASVAVADSLGNLAVLLAAMPATGAPSRAGVGGPVGRPGWQPLVAWIELNRGAGGKSQRAVGNWPQLAVLDLASGSGTIYGELQDVWAELRGVDGPLTQGIAAGDLDGDGFNEIVLSTRDGRIGFWNLSGNAAPGWPRDAEPEAFAGGGAPVVARMGGDAALDLVTATGSGRVYALGPDRKPLPGWPLGTGAGQAANPALLDLDGDGSLELLVADADSLLYAFAPPEAVADGAVWPLWGGDARRSFSLLQSPGTGSPGEGTPLVGGSVVCYPNPARWRPVTVSYRLSEPAGVTLTVFDPSGREVARLEQQGLASDNALVWDTAGAAPGLYLGRLEVRGASGSQNQLLHIGVLK